MVESAVFRVQNAQENLGDEDFDFGLKEDKKVARVSSRYSQWHVSWTAEHKEAGKKKI